MPATLTAATEERRLQVAASGAPAMIWTSGPDQRHDWFNPAWESFTGRSQDELCGTGWLMLVHPEDRERCSGILAASFEAREPYSLDYRLRRHDGQYRWVLDNGSPRFDASGAWAGYVGSSIDIDERKQLEERLCARVEALRRGERRQAAFLSMLSHELRNPLAPIANAASVLRSLETGNPVLGRLREILERQVGRIGNLVEELVDATRTAQGQLSMVKEPVTIGAIVRSAVEASRDAVERGGHALDLRLADEALTVNGDLHRLCQAVTHVITNAAKFTPTPETIHIGSKRVGEKVEIAVVDSGRGIDAAFLPQAFELFAQEGIIGDHKPRGLGVGLTVARRILQLHRGSIEIRSDGRGQGTRVLVTLPLANGRAATERHGADPADQRHVLVVTGDAATRNALHAQLADWGIDATMAEDLDSAGRAIEASRPDIVLCDLRVPGLASRASVAQLRRSLDERTPLFAALTDPHMDGGDVDARALAAGYDSFLPRPVESNALARVLRASRRRAPEGDDD